MRTFRPCKRFLTSLVLFFLFTAGYSQTVIPNGDFEIWVAHTGYNDPQGWQNPDSVLMSIPVFGKPVVFKSTDKNSGQYSAKLLTQNINLITYNFNAPGFITLGKLEISIINQTYSITGGVPIHDRPTHLMGFYKFQPAGGDSCAIGIALFKWISGNTDTVGLGYFTTKDAVNQWTHFTAWINYLIQDTPDTMNIVAISSAQTDMHPGTTLYVDDLYLDYTVGFNEKDPAAGISVYRDRETEELLVFCDFPSEQRVMAVLYDMTGRQVSSQGPQMIGSGRLDLPYSGLSQGIYILTVQHDGKTYSKKYMLGN